MTRTAIFSPYEIVDGDRSRGLLLLADHARNTLPEEYGSLGLPAAEFERHIAYDIGVETVTRELARQLDAPALLCGYSRLLVDPNRGEDDPTLIRQLYDGTVIPGNYPMAPEEREKRLELFYRPWHDAVGAMTASVHAASGAAPLIISIHSFTPCMQGVERPWHVGILWDMDDRAVAPLLSALRRDPDLVVGDNEPYDGALRGDTMYQHAIMHGYAHTLIEIRQDLIASEAGAVAWADRLAPILDDINRRTDIHQVRFFGSRTGPVQTR
ncbi:N-formylglutamate amidohydrolase [Aquibium carbonis]|uniref:N-formylglutamate amidohydrolase n=1 Tax=Aquibium carbonis TaxID=2495581 RepID=A0A3S0A6F9_9HYPH|nr:N-formylglutamate amidohydrolase [Aquibium carbonis]RST84920.1 N-formylglutamate amidohydrolase [Aquibium carbonis]